MGGHWLVNLVLMLEQKTMRKGTFYQGGQCAAPSSFRIRKTAFLWERVGFLKSD